MRKVYEMPAAVSLALTTERIEFLRGYTDEQLKEQIPAGLLRDLIEDRIKLRRELVTMETSIIQAQKQLNATFRKIESIKAVLDGRDPEVDDESED